MAFNFALDNKEMPLKLRKNIKEQGENAVEGFLTSIKGATGIDFAFQVHGDVVTFNTGLGDGSYEHRLGEIFFGSSGIMQSLVSCLTTGCADSTVKEALDDACTAKVIAFRVNMSDRPSGGLYHPLTIENGILFVDFYRDAPWTNVDEVSYTKIEDIPGIGSSKPAEAADPSGPFNFTLTNKDIPLKLRMNIKELGENVLEGYMTTIKAVTGVDFAFQVYGDVLAFNKVIESYENRLGEVFFGSSGIMQSLVSCLTTGCADDMIKEALEDACEAKVIAFRVNMKDRPSGGLYHPLTIENGILFVDFYKDAVWTNVDEVSWTKLEDMPGM